MMVPTSNPGAAFPIDMGHVMGVLYTSSIPTYDETQIIHVWNSCLHFWGPQSYWPTFVLFCIKTKKHVPCSWPGCEGLQAIYGGGSHRSALKRRSTTEASGRSRTSRGGTWRCVFSLERPFLFWPCSCHVWPLDV